MITVLTQKVRLRKYFKKIGPSKKLSVKKGNSKINYKDTHTSCTAVNAKRWGGGNGWVYSYFLNKNT